MTTEELGSVLERVGAMTDFVVRNPVMLAALAFMLNRFDRDKQMPSYGEVKQFVEQHESLMHTGRHTT